MGETAATKLARFNATQEREYRQRFPRSLAHFEQRAGWVLDRTSHAIRWNRPFMPVARRAEGPAIVDLDGHRILDYWQGHFANVLGHNPQIIRSALVETLEDGRGLQSGMLHEVEAEVSELVCRVTDSETVRLTTSGSLATFYATLLARGFTGRDLVLKVAGGWHGSQPFGLKGVQARDRSFDHPESEGLSSSATGEILLTRYNDIDDLRRLFEQSGDRIACFLIEPMLGAGGGIPASLDYLREARRLTEQHGALLLCDEIITGFRFRAGDLTALYGIKADLLILGKVMGGGMPVAAVAGREEVLALCTREIGRVKFEGGTYSAHEASLVAARTLLKHLIEHEQEIYRQLGQLGQSLRKRIADLPDLPGLRLHVTGSPDVASFGSSLVYLHTLGEAGADPQRPEDLVEQAHPYIDDGLLKATLMLEDLSVHFGVGAVSTAHGEGDLDRTAAALAAMLQRFRAGDL
jgi:glutamate-1-semialdehyde 2,1-aminomutase